MSEDRLIILGEEHFEDFYVDQLNEAGLDFLHTAKSEGLTPVLISDSLNVLVEPLAQHLKIDHVISNRLEMRNGKATGRLESPISTGRVSGQHLRDLATHHHWDLGTCRGYGSQETDITLLSALGHPCTVHPDRNLRAIAQDLQWPIVEC
jgi:HAD superfamily phosphoserine phosphatase-like hydrolase